MIGALAVAALVACLLAAMALVRRVAVARGWQAETQRKIVHVGAGALSMTLPWLLSHPWQVWLLLGLTALAMLALRTGGGLGGIGGALHGVERKSWGDFLLVAAVALTFLLHDGRAILYVLPLAILTLGDAAAALAGVRYGRVFYQTEDGRKSVEGSAMFFLVALILSMVCLLLLTDVPRVSVIVLATAVAGFATLVEADSWQGFDNLFLPMGVLIFLWPLIDAAAGDAALRAGLTLAVSGAVYALVRALGLTPRMARIHAVAAFLLVSATTPVNAILPLALLVTHALLASGPERGPQTLSVIAALAVVSFVFLAAGAVLGRTAINLFGLAAAAMAAGRIALGPGDAAWRILRAAICAAGLWGFWRLVVAANGPAADWHGPLGPVAAVLVAAAAALSLARPGWFRSGIGPKLAITGAVPALIVLAWEATR
ncbi:hypothetical protein HKCCE2091_19315 [Rhodobacterales bacterium HKCCE2091]|nr:hypothetical protein [Rhodobacterales bacterium HKCCE2091]